MSCTIMWLTSFFLSYTVIGSCGDNERGKRPMLTKIATDKSDVTMLTSDNPGSEDPCEYADRLNC